MLEKLEERDKKKGMGGRCLGLRFRNRGREKNNEKKPK